jgi:folate-dependent phosphoribosylglycinamide formyltransferase PurN
MTGKECIVVVGGRSETSYLLINHLATHFNVAHVVFEGSHTRKLLRYRLRVLGAWTVAGQLAFLLWDRLWIQRKSRAHIVQLLNGRNTEPPDARIPTTDVASINSAETLALLTSLHPSVVVVTGTGIISRRALASAPCFINIHCGITPPYRGVHGAFWAIFEGHPELAGVTIHRVDPGVDTGAILKQHTIAIDAETDSYRTLPVKQYLAGLEPMVEAVRDALNEIEPAQVTGNGESRQWYSPTLRDYWRFCAQLRRMQKSR